MIETAFLCKAQRFRISSVSHICTNCRDVQFIFNKPNSLCSYRNVLICPISSYSASSYKACCVSGIILTKGITLWLLRLNLQRSKTKKSEKKISLSLQKVIKMVGRHNFSCYLSSPWSSSSQATIFPSQPGMIAPSRNTWIKTENTPSSLCSHKTTC